MSRYESRARDATDPVCMKMSSVDDVVRSMKHGKIGKCESTHTDGWRGFSAMRSNGAPYGKNRYDGASVGVVYEHFFHRASQPASHGHRDEIVIVDADVCFTRALLHQPSCVWHWLGVCVCVRVCVCKRLDSGKLTFICFIYC